MTYNRFDAFLDSPMNPELARDDDELLMQRAVDEQAKAYIDEIGHCLPSLMGEAVAAFMAADRHAEKVDSLLASPHARTLREEFALSDLQEAFAEKMTTLVIAIAKNELGYHY